MASTRCSAARNPFFCRGPENRPLNLVETGFLVQPLFGSPSVLDLHGELDLLLGCEQRNPADFLQVHANRVGHHDEVVVGVQVVPRFGAVLFDPDLRRLEGVEHPLERVGRSLGILQLLLDLAHGEKAALSPTQQEQLNYTVRCIRHR